MYPGTFAQTAPDRPAFIMAESGETVTYGELDSRSNQGAHLFRSLGLKPGDSIAIFMENTPRYLEICWAAQRSGLYYTCVSSRLTAEEADYIIGDCEAKIVLVSVGKAEVAGQLLDLMPNVQHRFVVDGEIPGYERYEDAISGKPETRIADEVNGADMLYSSGTTGRPKGIRVALDGTPPDTTSNLLSMVQALYGFRENMTYLSPAPLYHSAPLRYNMAVLRAGGTSIIMEHFDPERALEFIEKYKATHSQWVPTMFVRMLKMPEADRMKYDVSSLEVAIHAAAPCPPKVKQEMIAWWGEVIFEYYAGTEGNGFCAINSQEWLAHPGSVGKALLGELHILDDEGVEQPVGEPGTIFFSGGGEFEYFNDQEKTAESRNAKGWSTLGDVGYVDAEGYLYLTDRKAFMIISGGVNIYPQETEDALITHPKVADCAVFGVPNEDFGEEVKAVVQPANPGESGPDLEAELIEYCREHLAHLKCPRSIDFLPELPRHPTGKLYKRLLRDKYWGNKDSKIV